MRLALKRTYDALPILGLIEKFGSSERQTIDRAVWYIGVEHIKSLNEDNFWDQFESAEQLKEFMDESPETLSSGEWSFKVYQVQEDNTFRPIEARTVLETELAVIILALRIIQTRQGGFYYEIFCDSVAAGNLIHNYTPPKSDSTKKLVNETQSLLERAHGKVKLPYVKGHSDCERNGMAHRLANKGRFMKLK